MGGLLALTQAASVASLSTRRPTYLHCLTCLDTSPRLDADTCLFSEACSMSISVHLDPETERRLALLSEKTGRTKAALLREIVRQGIEDSEDYWLSADVLARVREGREKTHSAASVRKNLRMDK